MQKAGEKQDVVLKDTGERLLTTWEHVTVAEHLHRYALAVSLAAGKTVLDIASGEGYGSNLLGAVAKTVVGIDRQPEAVVHATKKYGSDHVTFVQGDAACIPCQKKTFDLVVSFETIEHIVQHETMLSEIRRVLKEDGFLLISSPDKANHGDRTGYVNDFHVKELYEQEFLALLARYFPHYAHLRQQVLTCSALWPAERTERVEVYGGSFQGFSRLTQLAAPSFHVVLAGATPPPSLPATVFDGTAVAQAFCERQEMEIANLNEYVHALKNELNKQQGVVVSLGCFLKYAKITVTLGVKLFLRAASRYYTLLKSYCNKKTA